MVYLDYAATTPMYPEVEAAMRPFLAEAFGNPSGAHAAARAAKTALEEAREQVAGALGVEPAEVVFTGGGTEADNLAVKGAARAARAAGRGDGVVTTAFEHKGVLAPCDRLAGEGFRVTRAPVTAGGVVDLDALARALDERTVVVSVMLVNNEIGTIQPLDQVAELVRAHAPHAVLHTDAVQAVPWLDVAGATAAADLVSVSAHKFGGPKGVGVLVRRGDVPLEPLIEGGGQEWGLRSGTANVAGALGIATALRVTAERRDREVARVVQLRDRLAAGLAERVPDSFVNGDVARKVAGNCHVGFPGVEAEALLVLLDREGVCAAAGSSCTSGATEPSHVLSAMGLARDDALASIRLSLGYASTDADVDTALEVIPRAVEQLRPAVVTTP
jgi:cysteine desulfurase